MTDADGRVGSHAGSSGGGVGLPHAATIITTMEIGVLTARTLSRTMLHLGSTVRLHRGTFGSLLLVAVVAFVSCVPASKPPPLAPTPAKRAFVVVPAESDAFPLAAAATTERLRRARLRGFNEPDISKVSLEVVQLSIECVEATVACYERVGKELSASQLLFAEIGAGPKRDSVKITITLFDVETKTRTRAVAKVFASEDDVPFGVADVVAEATKP